MSTAAAVRVGRGSPDRVSDSLLIASAVGALGLVATAVGAGVGFRHLLRVGLTTASGSGLALLLLGVVLLAMAGRMGWRRLHGWQRLWLLAAGLVGLLVMWSVAWGAMLAIAPRTPLGATTPGELGLAYRPATMRASDGVLLAGWYLPARNRAAVVTVPGSGSTRTGTLAQAEVLARHGFGVLMLDPRGQGASGGRAMDAGWFGERDLGAAVTFLRDRPEVDPARIGVLGLSMGGEEAIAAAAAVTPPIRAVVAEGATHRSAADKAGYLPGGVPGFVQRWLDRLTYGVAGMLSPAPTPSPLREAIARAGQTDFLLVAGGRAVDEAQASRYLAGAAPQRVTTWTVPAAGHTQALATARQEWTQRVIGFLDRELTTP